MKRTDDMHDSPTARGLIDSAQIEILDFKVHEV